ncbi:phage holin family protein [Clostridium bornimense]|uniref:phage holin family protein n=1 Tax=Clostridium bornimense TaxID=1216932 RepID=UPI001C11EBF1|nr:phage holin family protein [Clostridium bornimense]MBU5316642.1 phage holin family protein [Clostridium bornimense]
MDLLKYITDKMIILIPVLYIIGMIIKGTEKIKNKYIPVILLPLGIVGAIAIGGLNVDSILQGILITGVTVYGNQLITQYRKET